ncbi:hypothetical protein [Streptomyces spongiae]|nr:hypothetical protein [Streptomyces spongiae]
MGLLTHDTDDTHDTHDTHDRGDLDTAVRTVGRTEVVTVPRNPPF